MKKISYVLFFMAMLVFACSKDEMQNFYPNPDPLAKDASGNRSVAIIEVYPGDDLAAAFEEAKAAGKGSVVKLMEGTYEIGVTEVKEFFGTISGEGKGKTIITNRSDITAEEIMQPGKLPSVLTFIGGEVKACNLTIQLTMMDFIGNIEFSMLLFSDYSADYMPAKQHIGVQLVDFEIKGLRFSEPPYTFPFEGTIGIRCTPDILRESPVSFQRGNIDVAATNCIFSDLGSGLYIWGCKSGNIDIGTSGGNLFDRNGKGLMINENLGVNVKICNNEFITPEFHGNSIDLNTGEEALGLPVPFEYIEKDAGTYLISNNTFNITGRTNSIGVMDAWRIAHPEFPTYMKMIWQNNKFILDGQGAWLGWTYCIKNALFEGNTLTGNGIPYSVLINTNFWWTTDLPNNTSEGCRFINNKFQRENFIFYMDLNVNNYLLMGDLTNVIIENYGDNNKIIGKTNPNHANSGLRFEMDKIKEHAGSIY